VTCEACHGPGAAHVAAEGKAPLEPAKDSCIRCHTAEMSPAFDYEEAWPVIVHGK
jgi:mono/diheme cytochrome c family protein